MKRSLCFPLIQIKCGSHLLSPTTLVLRSSDHVMIQIIIMFLMVTRVFFPMTSDVNFCDLKVQNHASWISQLEFPSLKGKLWHRHWFYQSLGRAKYWFHGVVGMPSSSLVPSFSNFVHSLDWNVQSSLSFPKQFTVGVLDATLDLAALVLVGVVGFLGSEVVLSPVVSHCLRLSPFMWGGGCWLVWSASWALKWSCLPLSPVVSGCLPSCGGGCWLVWLASWALKWSCLPLSPVVSGWPPWCWLVWLASWALKWSCLSLSPVVSGWPPWCWLVWLASWALKWSCLPLSPFMWGVGVGWCGRLLGLWSGLVSRCLPLSPVVSLHVGGGCWLVWLASWLWSGLVSRCLPLSPVVSLHVGGGCWLVWSALGLWSGLVSRCLPLSSVVSLHVGGGCWLVWLASWALKWSCLPLSPVVAGCLPSCGGWVLVGVAAVLGLWSGLVSRCLVVSGCLPSCGGVGVGWCGRRSWALKWSCLPLSRCLRLSPFMWGVGVGWCGRI